jgi:hypothetical protein
MRPLPSIILAAGLVLSAASHAAPSSNSSSHTAQPSALAKIKHGVSTAVAKTERGVQHAAQKTKRTLKRLKPHRHGQPAAPQAKGRQRPVVT